jgi:hypothetical protein
MIESRACYEILTRLHSAGQQERGKMCAQKILHIKIQLLNSIS